MTRFVCQIACGAAFYMAMQSVSDTFFMGAFEGAVYVLFLRITDAVFE